MSRSMTLAAFGGVYSNHPALAAVLAHSRLLAADHVYCLGDLGGFGPHPDRSIELLRESGVPAVQGNYDDAIGHEKADCDCGYSDPVDRSFAQIAFDYTLARTSPDHRLWLAALPGSIRIEVGGCRVLMCHGSPRRINEFLWESTSSDAFLEWLCAAHEADVLLLSHTGIPWERSLPSGRHVVNVGATGRPAHDGNPTACFAELEWNGSLQVRFHRVGYDHERVAREIEAEGLPAEFATTLRTGWWTTCLENLPARERRRGPA